MIKVGRRIYFNSDTGIVLLDIGEQIHYGGYTRPNVEQEINLFKELQDPNINIDLIDFDYGERKDEFNNLGSYYVDTITKEVIIYPRFILQDIPQPHPIGTETFIHVSGIEQGSVIINIEGLAETLTPVNGSASLSFTPDVVGEYRIEIVSEINGTQAITLGVE